MEELEVLRESDVDPTDDDDDVGDGDGDGDGATTTTTTTEADRRDAPRRHSPPEDSAVVVAPTDATHDRRVVELRAALSDYSVRERCEVLASTMRPTGPAQVVADAVDALHAWSADQMRDAMSLVEDAAPDGRSADAVIRSEAQRIRDRRSADWDDAGPLLRSLADDPRLREVLVDRIAELTRVHRQVDTDDVRRAVDAALDTAAEGPECAGTWAVAATAPAITRLVTALALQFLLSPDAGLTRSMVRCGSVSGTSAGTAASGRIGPLARRPGGALVSRPFRSGGVVVIGPPGVGKTALLKSVLATFRGAIVVSTNKPWDLQDVIATRLDAPVVSMDPSGSPLLHPAVCPVRVDPVDRLTSLRSAMAVAEVMVKAQNPMGNGSRDRFFLDHAERLAGALLWWAKLHGHDAAAAARALADLGRVARDLRSDDAGGEAFDVVRTVTTITDVTRSGILAQTAQVMKAWSIDRPAWERLGPLDPEGLIKANGTLLLCSDAQGAGDDNVVVTAALDQMVSARFEMAQRGESVPPLLLLLDECANTAPHHLVPSWTSTGPGRGVNTMLLFQDVSNQMARVWGSGGAEIVNNAGTVVVYPGVTDPALRQTLNGLAVSATVGVNPLDVVASASMPAPPPAPGTVYVVDEFARLEVGAQVRFHDEVGFVWSAVEAALRHDPEIVRSVDVAIRRIDRPSGHDIGERRDVSVIDGLSGRDTP